MRVLDATTLRAAIARAGHAWEVRAPAQGAVHALGWEPTPPARLRAHAEAAREVEGATARALPPPAFDWRDRGVIGAVRDQRACGSCVSFAVTGLVAAQAAIERQGSGLHLSEADSHFCSAHGAICHGWNNGDALQEARTRGIATDAGFPYMTAFDSPPVFEPGGDLWVAHCRAEPDRALRTWKIGASTAWIGATRKAYLAALGPLVCGFKVYEDFDSYGGGVYRHVSGNFRGGHAVLVVGYSDPEQAWICRNSWGTGFGGPARPDGTGAGYFKIGYGECGIDGEAFQGCQGVVPPRQPVFVTASPLASAVCRSADKLDVFAASAARGTDTAAWERGDTSWRGWWGIQGGVTAPNTSIFGVSRSRDKLDVFCVGTDHGIYTAAWEPGDTRWRGWWRVQGGVAAPNTSVHAVSRGPDKLDVFCVGTDMRVWTAAWEAGDTSWRGWWPVGNLHVAPGTSVYGVSRGPDKLDIFAVGADHGIYTAAWEAGDTAWRGWWRVQGGVAAPNTSVFPVSRGRDKLDVFCVGADHGIYTAAWEAGDTSWRGWWRVQGGVAAPNTSVFGVSRSTDKLDVFCVGTDHHIYTAAWQPGDARWRGWWPIQGGVAAPDTSVFAVSRSTDKLDVFCVGTDRAVYTAAWQAGDTSWRGWWPVAPALPG